MPILILVLFMSLVVTGCGGSSSAPRSPQNHAQGPGVPDDMAGVCGPLDFKGVVWSSDLSEEGRKAFATALNITGSFEGRRLWSTIAGNSDGQGVSLGLLQQNLGQGSLQPLLIRIRDDHPKILETYLAASDRSNILRMLSVWQRSAAVELTSVDVGLQDDIFLDENVLSPLDEGYDEQSALRPLLASHNAVSVKWAKSTLYHAGGDRTANFISRWKQALTLVAATAEYRTLQIEKAQKYFDRAESYFNAFKFRELRSFFLMFDFVVQNGGFSSTHRNQYNAYLKANPSASETAKAKKLLEIRLKSVTAKYRADVRARKTAIIDGKGTVHGSSRNLPKENCYEPRESLSL